MVIKEQNIQPFLSPNGIILVKLAFGGKSEMKIKKPARHHHYISQCYLKGFTKGGSKKSKLTVVDFKEKKLFETISRNVGGIRDFNRIEVEGTNPNTIEQSLARFEGKIDSAIQKLEQDLSFEGETRDLILFLIDCYAETLTVEWNHVPEGEAAMTRLMEKNKFVKFGLIEMKFSHEVVYVQDFLDDLRKYEDY